MAKITFTNVKNNNTLSAINDNFAKVAAEMQNKILYRANPPGETNTVRNDLDMDGNDIVNLDTVSTENLIIDGQPVTAGDFQALTTLYPSTLRTPNAAPINTIPSASNRAGKFLAFDVQGQPVSSSGTGNDPALRTDLAQGTGSTLVGFLQSGTGAVPRSLQDKARETLSVKDFGAVGDGVTDDTLAIQKAANACAINSYDVGRGGPTLVFPEAVGYRVTAGITVAAGVPVEMRNTSLLYNGVAEITVLTIGAAADRSFRCRFVGLDVRRDGNINRLTEADIGIRIINAFFCDIEIRGARGFTIGAQLNGVNPGEGCYYNRVKLGYFFGNRYNLDLKGGDGTQAGWVNENLFLGGECQGGMADTYTRYGVRIWNTPAGSIYNDNNVFLKPSFEMNGSPGAAIAIPFYILHSHGVRVINGRQEGNNSGTFARIENNSRNTDIHVGQQQITESNIVDLSLERSTTFQSQKLNWSYHGRVIYQSGALGRITGKYNATRYHVPGLNFYRQVDTTLFNNSGPLTLAGNAVTLGATDGVARMIDTNRCKKFVVDIDSDAGCWVVVQAFDAAGVALTSAGANAPYVMGPGFVFSSGWQGYAYAAAIQTERLFTVHDDVKSVRVCVYNGTVRGFSIMALGVNNQFAATYAGYEEVSPGANIGTAAPTTDTWAAGRRVVNATPTVGQPKAWICTVSGTPGTWVSEGNL